MKTNHILTILTVILTVVIGFELYYFLLQSPIVKKENNIQSDVVETKELTQDIIAKSAARFRYRRLNSPIVTSGILTMEYLGNITYINQDPGVFTPDHIPRIKLNYQTRIFINHPDEKLAKEFYLTQDDLKKTLIFNQNNEPMTFKDLKVGNLVLIKEKLNLLKQEGLDYEAFEIYLQ